MVVTLSIPHGKIGISELKDIYGAELSGFST
jgi:hypothetical protein